MRMMDAVFVYYPWVYWLCWNDLFYLCRYGLDGMNKALGCVFCVTRNSVGRLKLLLYIKRFCQSMQSLHIFKSSVISARMLSHSRAPNYFLRSDFALSSVSILLNVPRRAVDLTPRQPATDTKMLSPPLWLMISFLYYLQTMLGLN